VPPRVLADRRVIVNRYREGVGDRHRAVARATGALGRRAVDARRDESRAAATAEQGPIATPATVEAATAATAADSGIGIGSVQMGSAAARAVLVAAGATAAGVGPTCRPAATAATATQLPAPPPGEPPVPGVPEPFWPLVPAAI
jgi:hypothetical protein